MGNSLPDIVTKFNWSSLPSPCYVVFEQLLKNNLEMLQSVKERTGCKILLAQKGFSMFSVYPLIGEYLDGATASSLFEARLGREEMGGEVHIFAPAYRPDELDEIIGLCDHIVCNSHRQWELLSDRLQESSKRVSCGLRVNPEMSTASHAIYDPCAPHSRLGLTRENFCSDHLDGLDGLHFHCLCEQNADDLKRVLDAFEEKFGDCLSKMKWINFGGGHHITRNDYDIGLLCNCITRIQDKYNVQVYLEPGEAVALNTGFLVSTVLETLQNGMDIAILDTSASCHMPDVLEMPYRPNLIGAGLPNEKTYTYRLGGPTCLAGDIIGDYSFVQPLRPGDRLVFCDMAHYSMVKNNTFNGINLPSIVLCRQDGQIEVVRCFGYDDFKRRLS